MHLQTLNEVERLLFTKHQRFDYLQLHDKQLQAISYLTDNVTVEVLFGGAATGGKSWLGCVWLQEMCRHYPGTRWFIARKQLKDIRQSTFITWRKVCRSRGLSSDDWKFNGQDNCILFTNGSQIDFLECDNDPGDPDFDRLGSKEYTGGWIEEGAQIVRRAYEVLRSRIGRHMNDVYGILRKLLTTSNPKRNWMREDFIIPMREGKLPAFKRFIQSLVDDNIYAESGSKENLESLRLEVDRRRLLLGDWDYDSDENRIVSHADLSDMFHRTVAPGDRFITADIARYGKDTTRIGVWNGGQLFQIVTLTKSSVPNTAAEIKRLEVEHRVSRSRVCIDDDGVGGGVSDLLPGCYAFINNSSPIPRSGENAGNLKSQCGFEIAKRIGSGEIGITCNEETKLLALEDLYATLKIKNIDGEGKRYLIAKQDVKQALGRSPDVGDIIIMRAVYFLNPPVQAARSRGTRRG